MALHTLFLCIALLVVYTLWKRYSARHSIPHGLKPLPGPKGIPFLGVVPQVPEKNAHIKFADWGKQYGPIYQCNLAGTNHVWISSDQIAKDLLAKKGAIYSDRPHIPALESDNRTSAQYLPLLSKNDAWLRQRKFATHIMRASEAASFHHYPELEAKRLLTELLDAPHAYNTALESFVARVTCRLAWGHADAADELKQRARELLIAVSPTGALGNRLPAIMRLPAWLSPSKAWEQRRARTERAFFTTMQRTVEHDMRAPDADAAPQSWMRAFLEAPSRFGFVGGEAAEGAYAVGMHGIAGALTIAAPMQTFCLAMCWYPQFLPLLHEELDRVCGERLPCAGDRAELPFLRACIRECFRWRPPVPTGIPHALTQDDEYNGYHIPAGSVMHPLEWAISRTPSLYPSPETFNPLRWLDPASPVYQAPLTTHPTIIGCSQFGYGRRVCQGQAVADEDLLVGIGSLAWLFDIGRTRQKEQKQGDGDRQERQKGKPAQGSKRERHEADDQTQKPKKLRKPAPHPRNTLIRPTISAEELHTGFRDSSPPHSPTTPSSPFPQSTLPSPPLPDHSPDLAPQTLSFSKLLIAKPLPFDFALTVRRGCEKRVEMVRGMFDELKERGEFGDERRFWGALELRGYTIYIET
ncbi:cytochrome P450 [Pseudovirgaria hyperparasitica]|uniref:Cytochrome P450 n=1 Tax=Pseudovirgaria hyperparasitica TaxID=470096 RepID=A0A6A6W4N0_9PEZI|nr:cytochrome P450 [Pseudovirgaria hyperparasitica]KAF2756517.1 cytochrome P450 [Pseudovirgaria hyperparasitica]